ncbi:MAG: hypothetical protein KatS3mg005_0815 [Bryobacteraceae bacterium]|nr:MAG: hypothetical protein KatS3mg005_0815 [Bryobacteraceae bacterium]
MNRTIAKAWCLFVGLGLACPGQVWFSRDWEEARATGKEGRAMLIDRRGGHIAHVAMGGPWRTIFTVINTSETAEAVYDFWFRTSRGERMTLTLDDGAKRQTGHTFELRLPPSGSLRLETVSSSPDVQVGWASFYPKTGLEGDGVVFATFRAKIPDKPDYEALVPLDFSPGDGLVPFDNRNGFGTAIAVVNPFPSYPLELEVEIRDREGRLLETYRERLPELNHMAFQTAERWPAAAGREGLIVLKRVSEYGGFAALGLLFNPTGSVTTVPVTSSVSW